MPITSWLLVGAGGAVGAMARYAVYQATTYFDYPLATLLVNTFGSMALAYVLFHPTSATLGLHVHALVGVGFLGAFTTMSTLSVETISMIQAGAILRGSLTALVNLGCSVAGALAGAWLAIPRSAITT